MEQYYAVMRCYALLFVRWGLGYALELHFFLPNEQNKIIKVNVKVEVSAPIGLSSVSQHYNIYA